MSKVLIIGCGGVASVAIHKCCQVPEVFAEICIASRTKSKCDKLAAELAGKTATKITTAQVDADKTEEVIALIERAEREGKTTVRLHTGDPSIYGAVREQFDALTERGIDFDVCPGVSSFCGAAAALRAEYTLPNVSQTVIITRAAGRTPVPERESIRSLAAHQATMVLFLSTSLTEKLQGELLAGGYGETTPAAVVYKATWPEEKIFRCTVGTLHKTVTENGMKKTALIVVGGCLGDEYLRSLLYHPDFTTEYRKGKA